MSINLEAIDKKMADRQVEDFRVKTYEEILEDAEVLKPGDIPALEQVLKDAVTARLAPVRMAVILSTAKTKSGTAIGDLRAQVKDLRKNGGASPEDMGQRIVNETLNRFYQGGKHLIRANGQFWEYAGTHWSMKSDEQISNTVMGVIRESIRPEDIGYSSALSQALAILRADRAVQHDVFRFKEAPLPIINCLNGELWINKDGTTELRPHSPDSFLTYCLGFEFSPYAVCPTYDKTLLEIFGIAKDPEDMARHWNEFFGYAIQPVRDIPSWWMLKGHGSNGKSKLIETITYLLGPDAVASVRLDTLDTQFGRSPLLGKLLMVDDDVDAGTKLPDGILKQISERKRISVEFKNQTPFDAVLNVLPVMLCNNFPVTSDVTHGMMRRAYVIPFYRQFKEDEQDPERFTYIWENEMPGVLNRALQGLARLRTRHRFLLPSDCAHAISKWLAEANPLKAFLDECVESAAPGLPNLRLPDLYKVFDRWAKESGVKHIVTRNKMRANLEALGYTTSRTDGISTVVGVKLTTYGYQLRVDQNER